MSLDLTTEMPVVPADTRHHCMLLATVTAPEAREGHQRQPLNLALVLDRSASMAGDKLVLAKQALRQAVAGLDAMDRISIVVFGTEAQILASQVPGGQAGLELVDELIDGIEAGTATNLERAWRVAEYAIVEGVEPQVITRCLLITDGRATVGNTDHVTLRDIASELRQRGITTSAFGIGSDFDEELLAAIADAGGGSFQYVQEPADITARLERELGEAIQIVARDVDLHLSLPRDVDLSVIGGWPVQVNEDELIIELPDLAARQRVVVAAMVDIAALSVDSEILLAGELHWSLDGNPAMHGDVLKWSVVTAADAAAVEPDDAVVDQVLAIRTAQARLEAIRFQRKGDVHAARDVLHRLGETIRCDFDGLASARRHSEELLLDEQTISKPMDEVLRKTMSHRAWSQRSRGTSDGTIDLKKQRRDVRRDAAGYDDTSSDSSR